VLDTHDGIGVIDVGADSGGEAGLLPPADIDDLVETIHARSNGQSRQATGAAASNLDLYQVNCTFYDALGRRDPDYLIARALQLFAPGVPQVYYVGLLAGCNDMELLARTGVGRDINRHYYTPGEVDAELGRPVVRSQIDLMRFRNAHPAFGGEMRLETPEAHRLAIEWQRGADLARLEVDLSAPSAWITCSSPSGTRKYAVIPESTGIAAWDARS
jgi:sucrose phosphorylase